MTIVSAGKNRWYLLPIVLFLWFPATFVITYAISVGTKDVVAVFPYISDTGTFSPQSCIFGQMLNLGSLLLAFVAYLRYRQIEILMKRHDLDPSLARWNRYGIRLALVSSFGISVVANFQESNVLSVHMLGAFLAFGVGQFYLLVDLKITLALAPYVGVAFITNVRKVLAVTNVMATTICGIAGAISLFQFTGSDMTKWSEEDGGYRIHLASTGTEWIAAICTMAYLSTLSEDLKSVRIDEPVVQIAEASSALPTAVITMVNNNNITPIDANSVSSPHSITSHI